MGGLKLQIWEKRKGGAADWRKHSVVTFYTLAKSDAWYIEECRLEDLSFMAGERAALAEEFRAKNRKISYIDQKNAAQDRFKRRLGNLDDKFFDIIPKSLAFKPMDNVKEFINKFVLSEERVDVVSLRENIETLSELENILDRSRRQQGALERILDRYDEIEEKDRSILVNDILLKIANRDAVHLDVENLEKKIRVRSQSVESNRGFLEEMGRQIKDLENQILAIRVDIEATHSNALLQQARGRIEKLEGEISQKREAEKKLREQVRLLMNYLRDLERLDYKPVKRTQAEQIGEAADQGEQAKTVEKLEAFAAKEQNEIQKTWAILTTDMDRISGEIDDCQERLKKLEKRVLPYPEYARKLKEMVEKEFVRRGIPSSVYFLSELLEITDGKWSNAIEGYLNTQKFYLVVEPEYYHVALGVYDKNRKNIHTAGIINSRKLPMEQEAAPDSLAYVVKSDNRYAKAYANYILGRVKRCIDVHELEQHSIAMTPECMLYQGYVVRHLNPRDYENPFIGQYAYRAQIENVKKEIEEKTRRRSELRQEIQMYTAVQESAKKVNLGIMKLYLYVPESLHSLQEQMASAKTELKEAQSDPTLIELNLKLDAKQKELGVKETEKDSLNRENIRLENQIDTHRNEMQERKKEYDILRTELEEQADRDGAVYKEADDKYRQNRKSKSAQVIAVNFAPQRSQLLREREELLDGRTGLKELQMRFNQEFTLDFVMGLTNISEYREALQKLKSVEIVRYEEKLKLAREDCEQIFRSDFLSRMKENIESARNEFRSLNKALDSIYYGDDSYRFKISFDKNKEGLYRMITSENNYEGINLWISAFEEEYREEMVDLFDKLMARDDKGQQRKVLEHLLDSYERSRTFRGDNQVSQRFSVSVGKLFPKYNDDAEYDYFCQINESMEELCAEGLVTLAYWKKGVLKKITLNPDRLDVCYEMLGRMARRREQEELVRIWDALCQGEGLCRRNESRQEQELPLVKYITAQRLRVEKNLNVEYYNHDLEEYRELLLAVKAVLENQEEIFIRNLSMQLFHDSKRMEQLKHKAEALLYQYGAYQERDCVLEECGIVHTPTYVMMKGNGRISIGRKGKTGTDGQEIDLSLMEGDIALSTESVKSLKAVTVMGKRVVTVENLTSFHDYPAEDDFVVYLGGFHNKVKRDFLLYLYQRNSEKEYRHFGDIDAGGFYILEHLKKATGIPFRSLYMDTKTLERYRGDRKPLTGNDRKRLLQLKEELAERMQHEETEDYGGVISYMLDENCKLEQEAVNFHEQ